MRIDAHQHFWVFNEARDTWITEEMHAIRRDFLPHDLKPLLEANGMDGCIAVQADPSDHETSFLIELAHKHRFIKGVVGWIDLKAGSLEAQLEKYADQKVLKGFRHILQAEPDGFMSDPKFIKGVSTLARHRYTYDILIYERQMAEAITFINSLPEMPLVIDHLAKPGIKEGALQEWGQMMKRLASYPHVYMKLSGMITEADWSDWKNEDLYPYMEVALEAFGPERLMFGSDWPVCRLAGNYQEVIQTVESFISSLSPPEKQKIMGKNAVKFYGLE